MKFLHSFACRRSPDLEGGLLLPNVTIPVLFTPTGPQLWNSRRPFLLRLTLRRGAVPLRPVSAELSRHRRRTPTLCSVARLSGLGVSCFSLRRDHLLRRSANVTTPHSKISPPNLTFAMLSPLTLRLFCSLGGELFSSFATSSRFLIPASCSLISNPPFLPRNSKLQTTNLPLFPLPSLKLKAENLPLPSEPKS
jgi:hypothetical protein